MDFCDGNPRGALWVEDGAAHVKVSVKYLRRGGGVAMPKYYEDKVEDKNPCAGVKEDLSNCLLETACVLQEGKTPKECLKEGHCRALQVTFFECKRSILDNRARFRGRKGY